MVRKVPAPPRRAAPPSAEPDLSARAAASKALTINVPIDTLNRARTRASLEGRTLSSVVSDAMRDYAQGLGEVLARLDLAPPGRT